MDEIFWDIFDMPDNKNERFSLRVEGAFCCPSYIFDEKVYKIENTVTLEEQINSFFYSEMVKVEQYVENIRANYADFLLYIIEKDGLFIRKVNKYDRC